MIKKDKWQTLYQWMMKLNINDSDLVEKFIIGSGKGGQNLHKTASMVYLKHVPSNIEIKCQDTRFREDNRYFARLRLCEKLNALYFAEKSKKEQEREKIKRQKKRRSRRAQKKVLEDKARQGVKKDLRQKPSFDD